jgi:hypothetical protein
MTKKLRSQKIGPPLKRVLRNEAVKYGQDVLTHDFKQHEKEYMRNWMANQQNDSDYYDARVAYLANGTIPQQYADLGSLSGNKPGGPPDDQPSQTPTPTSLKRKAAAIVDDTRSSPPSLPPTFVNVAVSQSHLPATIGDTQSSSLPLPPGYSYSGDLTQNSFSGSLHSLHSISYPPIPDDDHLARPFKISKRADTPSRTEGASPSTLSDSNSNGVDGGGLRPASSLEPNEPQATELEDEDDPPDPFTTILRSLTEEFPEHREEGFPAQAFHDYLAMLNDRSGSCRELRHKFVDYCESWGILPRSVAYGEVTASPGLPTRQRLNARAREEPQPGWTYDSEFVTNALEDSPAPAMGDAYDDHVPFAQSAAMYETGETASHASQEPEISKDDWERRAVAAEVRSVEMLADIYAACDGLWLGTEDTMAMSMAATIDAAYNGRAAAFSVNVALTDPGAPASPMHLSRDDFLSLWRQNWLTDELINVILGILFPLQSKDVICLSHTTRFNALVTSTHSKIAQGQQAVTAKIDGFDQGAPPFNLHEEVDAIVGVMNYRDLHWFV